MSPAAKVVALNEASVHLVRKRRV